VVFNLSLAFLYLWSLEMNRDELLNEMKKLRNNATHYQVLLDESMDPTFSFYADGTYRYVNKAFARGTGKPLGKIIGNTIWDVFEKDEADKRFAIVKKVFAEERTEEIEVRVPLPSGDTYYLTTVKPIFNDLGTVETVICTSKNITKRKLAEIALKEKHEKLIKAMEEIKVLSGLLPICSSCKKIRDDKGYWNQIEAFIQEHSEAKFSHSICKECVKKLYPDLDICAE
jgi:PAS domain S-box-containing protein